jgi:hypothetical protein
MSPKTTKLISGAELRRRAADRLAQQNVPNGEAGRRERKLLEHYSAAQEDLQWIVDNNAHVDLGFETFTEWYKARVLPAVKAAGLRPTPEFALYVLDRVLADDGIKPAAQKHIHRELAEITGLSDHALRRALQDRSGRRNDAGADLEEAPKSPLVEAMTQAIEDAQTAAEPLADIEDPADGGEGGLTAPDDLPASGPSASPSVDGPDVTPDVVHLVSQFRPQTAPECAVGDGKTIGGASRTTCPACLAWLAGRDGWKWVHGASKAYPGDPACERCGRELDEGIVKAAQTRCITCDPDRLHYAVEVGGACEPCAALDLETAALVAEMGAAEDSAAAPSEAASAPAGQPQVPDVLEVVPMVATDQPGIEPPIAVGEAPTPASSVAGVEPSPEAGVLMGGDEVEGEAGPSSSTDPDEPFADAAWTFMDGWRAFVRQVAGVDVEAVGPMLREDEFTELYGDLELLREQVKKLQRHA